MLAKEARSVYDSGKEFVYDHVSRYKNYPIDKAKDTKINITVNSQRTSMKGLTLDRRALHCRDKRFRKVYLS